MRPDALSEAVKASLINISSLESSSDNWGFILHVSAFLVVIGVAMELYIVWKEYHEAFEAWSKGIIRPPDKPDKKLFAMGLIGAGLVALGVFGEVSIGVWLGTLQTKLRV